MKDVAKQYRIWVATISSLLKKGKRNPKFLTEVFEKRDQQDAKRTSIKAFIEALNEQDHFIDSAECVVNKLLE